MFDRFKRSMDLVKASAQVLRKDTHLLVFPFISGLTSLFVMASFALPVFGLGLLERESGGEVMLYSTVFAFYVVQYFVIFYFNVALVGATMMRFDGGSPTVADGLRIANARFGSILGYAVIAATVGMILRAIQERVGFLGRIIVGLIGASWTVATALVVPVLVSRDKGPIDAIKESTGMLKQTWGENVIGQVGMSLFFNVIIMALVLSTITFAVLAFMIKSAFLVALVIVLGGFMLLGSFLVHAALSGIYSAALYRFAVDGNAKTGFDNGALRAAFLPKD